MALYAEVRNVEIAHEESRIVEFLQVALPGFFERIEVGLPCVGCRELAP
jgi:hypothetical protein